MQVKKSRPYTREQIFSHTKVLNVKTATFQNGQGWPHIISKLRTFIYMLLCVNFYSRVYMTGGKICKKICANIGTDQLFYTV